MINLLSTDRKSELRAARVNVFLLRYTGILALAILFIVGLLYFSYTILQQTELTAEARIATNDTKAEVYSATKAEVDALSDKLSEAKSQLDQEINYSNIIITLGQLMPAGTVIEALRLDEALVTSNAPTELIAYAKTDEAAAAIQQNLQSSPLFRQVSLQSTDSNDGIAEYPIKVTLQVTFNRSGM